MLGGRVALLLFVLVSPCATPGRASAEAGAAAEASRDGVAGRVARTPDRVILRLRDGVDVCLACRWAAGQSITGLPPGSRLAELLRARGVRGIRPLIPVRRGDLHAEPHATARARRRAAQARFPERRRRSVAEPRVTDWSRTWVVELRRDPDMAAVAAELARDAAVASCEPDAVVEIAALPNDPFLASQGSWGQPFDDLWGLRRIGAPAAWDVAKGAGVVVAIVDTGIDHTHPDIAANVWANPGEIPGNGIDDDGNGYVDDVRGWDFYGNDPSPLDENGHGTHVAGILAATGDNGIGVIGVAHQATVMPVAVLGPLGTGFVSDLVRGVAYAVDNGADVLNLSLTAPRTQALAAALADAHAAGVVIVASAGNGGTDVRRAFIAASTATIAVAASNRLDGRADFSNFGIGVDVAAPGGGDPPPPAAFPGSSVLSLQSAFIVPAAARDKALTLTHGGLKYLRLAGTSMAAPHVAGAAALLLAYDPGLRVEQVRQLLRTTALDTGPPGFDVAAGYGRLDVAAALAAAPPLEAHIASPGLVTLVAPGSIEVVGTARGPGFESYRLDYRADGDPDGWVPIAGPITAEVDDGVLASFDAGALQAGRWVLRLTAQRGAETFVDMVSVDVEYAAITEPRLLAGVPAGPVEIRGTAGGPGFVRYRVLYRRPAIDPNQWTAVGLSPAVAETPVVDGVLATLDASALVQGDRFDFRLLVESADGTVEKVRYGVVIDPTLRPGWPRQLVPVEDSEYLTVADLDGDGVMEILVGSGDEVVVFEPDGSVRPGWPQRVTTLALPHVTTRGSPIVADITGDGAPEVIATNRTDVFAWSAAGELLPGFPVAVDVFAAGAHDWLTAGDVDGDGVDEIVCTGLTGIRVIDGDGSFVGAPIVSSFGAHASAVGDADGDGVAEIARVDHQRSANGKVRARGMAELRRIDGRVLTALAGPIQPLGHVAMADLDGDGRLEVVWLEEDRKQVKLKPRSVAIDGRRKALRAMPFARPKRPSSGALSFADLDGDGAAEAYAYVRGLAGGEAETGAFVSYRQRTPDMRFPLRHTIFETAATLVGGVAIGDVDGDGVQELVAGVVGDTCRRCGPAGRRLREAVVVQRLDGSLLPGFPKPIPVVDPSGDQRSTTLPIPPAVDDRRFSTPAIADLDGDGLKDILWVDPIEHQLLIWNVPGTPGPLLADWPMYQHDARHSNVLPAD
ncbi:MAG: S8 family serine peptidase [bacterium]|nr:S8 family serine peptidase [bacterium]